MQAIEKKDFLKQDLDNQLNDETSLILAVDNDRDNLFLVNLILSYLGYDLVMSANTQTALSMVERDRPDLILLGINLPGTKEMELLCQLKQDLQTRSIPIFALTAISNPDYLNYLLDAGCDYCLVKPYLLKDLHKIIRDRYQLLPTRSKRSF
ncbi:response regulator [Myxosarcina sp. GI1(2024)]